MTFLLKLTFMAAFAAAMHAAQSQPQSPPKPARVAATVIELKRDAELGHRKAQKSYGDHFKAIEQYVGAQYWYRAAAVQGDAAALCALGDLYLADKGHGTNFVKANLTNSVVLHKLAALQGWAPSHAQLSTAYRFGKSGVAIDNVQAYKHLLLSERSDREFEARKMVLSMTQQEIVEAERLAKEFKPLPFVDAFEELAFQAIRIGGTMGADSERLAFLNGSIVAPGGMLRIQVGSLPAVLRCKAIDKDSITLSFNNKERALPLRRPRSSFASAPVK